MTSLSKKNKQNVLLLVVRIYSFIQARLIPYLSLVIQLRVHNEATRHTIKYVIVNNTLNSCDNVRPLCFV